MDEVNEVNYQTMKLKEQTILGFDASGFSVSVGIMENGIAKGLIFLNDGTPGSEILLSTVDQLLKTLKMEKESLEGICVTLGPGSFTSLRISLAVAESIGIGLNIPVYGVDTLQLIAATVPFYPYAIKVVQNAYKGEFYSASYRTQSGHPQEVEGLSLIQPTAFYEKLQPNDLVLGTGVGLLLQKKFDLKAKHVCWNEDFHRSISGISVIEHFLETEVRASSLKPLEPIYIRLSDAEINYHKQFGVKNDG